MPTEYQLYIAIRYDHRQLNISTWTLVKSKYHKWLSLNILKIQGYFENKRLHVYTIHVTTPAINLPLIFLCLKVQDVTSDKMRALMRFQFWKDSLDNMFKVWN